MFLESKTVLDSLTWGDQYVRALKIQSKGRKFKRRQGQNIFFHSPGIMVHFRRTSKSLFLRIRVKERFYVGIFPTEGE